MTSVTNASDLQRAKNETGQARPGRGGMITPEATPEPDTARNNADLKRRQEVASQGTEGDGVVPFATTKDQPPDTEDENESSTSKDEKTFQEILACGNDEYRKILGVAESYENPKAEEEAILTGLWDRGDIAKPRNNKHKDAGKAFKMVLEAAAALGVNEQQIKEVEDPEKLADVDSMEGVQDEVPRPHKIIVGIYQKATPIFAQLQKLPKSNALVKRLDDLNAQIKKNNEKEEIDPSDQWFIRYQDFAKIYQEAKPLIDRIQKDPNDSEAYNEFNAHSRTLAHIISRNHYLDWNISLDNVASKKSAAPADSTSKPDSTPALAPTNSTPALAPTNSTPASAPANSTPASAPANSTPALAPANSTPESAPETRPAEAEGQSVESSQDKGPQVSAQEVPARFQAAKDIQLETLKLWAHMGWSTHKMSDGDIILSHKPLSRRGQEPYAQEFTVMTENSPYFQIQMGSEIGRKEMDIYLALPNIHTIRTDPGDEKTQVYTYRDQVNYAGLLWTATKPRKQTEAGKKPRTGDTRACVKWKDGNVAEMPRASFKKVTPENEIKAITKFCESLGIKAPWEMDPKTLTVSAVSALGKQLLQAGSTSSAINFNSAAPKVEPSIAENPGAVSSSLQSSLAALEKSLQAMDSRFEKSLQAMDSKFEKSLQAMDSKFETSQVMMQEQLKKQLDLQGQMQQQLQKQQEDQAQINRQLIQLLGQMSAASSQGSTSN